MKSRHACIVVAIFLGLVFLQPHSITSAYQGGGTIPGQDTVFLPITAKSGVELCNESKNPSALTLTANHLFVGICSTLEIYDISQPQTPQLISQTTVDAETITQIAVQGNYAYLLNHNIDNVTAPMGMTILNIANPVAPSVEGLYNKRYIGSLAIQDSYAYLASGGLDAVDISEPLTPKLFRAYSTAEIIGDRIRADASYLYVEDFHELAIYNKTNPAQITPLSHIGDGTYTDLQIRGNLAILSHYDFGGIGGGHISGFDIFDITDRALPSNVSRTLTPHDIFTLDVNDNRVYLIDPRLNTGGLIIYDISTPATPTYLGELLMPASQIAVGGSYAYVTASAQSGLPELYVVDVSTPSQPTIVATISFN